MNKLLIFVLLTSYSISAYSVTDPVAFAEYSEAIANLTWVHAGILLGIFLGIPSLIIYKIPLSGFIDRIKRAGPTGFDLWTDPNLQLETKKKIVSSAEKSDSEADHKLLSQPVKLEVIASDGSEALKQEFVERGINSQEDKITLLIDSLLQSKMTLGFHEIYRLIFGSQLKLLMILNERSVEGTTEKFMQSYCQEQLDRYPVKFEGWDVEKYLTFLFRYVLIVKKNDKYYISKFCGMFLRWMSKNEIPTAKPL